MNRSIQEHTFFCSKNGGLILRGADRCFGTLWVIPINICGILKISILIDSTPVTGGGHWGEKGRKSRESGTGKCCIHSNKPADFVDNGWSLTPERKWEAGCTLLEYLPGLSSIDHQIRCALRHELQIHGLFGQLTTTRCNVYRSLAFSLPTESTEKKIARVVNQQLPNRGYSEVMIVIDVMLHTCWMKSWSGSLGPRITQRRRNNAGSSKVSWLWAQDRWGNVEDVRYNAWW